MYPLFAGTALFYLALLPASILAVAPLLAQRALIMASQPLSPVGVQVAAISAVSKGVFGGLLAVYGVRVLREFGGIPWSGEGLVLIWLSLLGYLFVALLGLLFAMALVARLVGRERTLADRLQPPLGLAGLAIAFAVLILTTFDVFV